MKNVLYSIKSKLLTIFGDIKIFKWPMFLIYQPTGYRIKGKQVRKILSKIQPGDVVMRGYNYYLDGFFIPKGQSNCSHSGIYIGNNKVIHSIAEGVTEDELIDFLKCDYTVILRPKISSMLINKAIKHAKSVVGKPYDFNFDTATHDKYFCHEFTRSCFPTLNIEKVSGKASFLSLESPKTYLADSFYLNDKFKIVCKYN